VAERTYFTVPAADPADDIRHGYTGLRLNSNPRDAAQRRRQAHRPVRLEPKRRLQPWFEIVTKVPGLDTQAAFDATGAVPIYDMARAFDPDQPVVPHQRQDQNRQLIWSEIDANPTNPRTST